MEYESVIRAVSQQSEDVEKRAKWLTDRCLQDLLDGKTFDCRDMVLIEKILH